ncbi:MAG: hypothetical protein IT343_02065 [Candidatus Melainabacteria bacterium]|jgi:predicted DNA-binding protein (UPF0251 family)|nr:hypothetical protein [Candidatus Melainabacteria bacterium]
MFGASKQSEILLELVRSANVVDNQTLDNAISIAQRLNLPLERALMQSGSFSEESMRPLLAAKQMVENNTIRLDTAINAIRLAQHDDIDFHQALKKLMSVHQKTLVTPSMNNDLTDLLMQAQLINQDQFGRAMQKSLQTKILIGRVLVITGDITSSLFGSALQAVLLIREKAIERGVAIDALRLAQQKNICLEQALFEMGSFKTPAVGSLKLSELMRMSGLISESELAECLEIELFKNKPFGQVLREQGLATDELLENAMMLQGSVAGGELKAYQAAEAMRLIAKENMLLQNAINSVMQRSRSQEELRLGELLIESCVLTREAVETTVTAAVTNNVKIGKMLLDAGLITKSMLHRALRCQSLLKYGVVSKDQAVKIMSSCKQKEQTLDQAITGLGLAAPTRMQWSWV